MTQDDALEGLAVRLTRAAPLFDRLVEHVLAGSDPPPALGVAEQRGAREFLDRFFPEFRRMYGQLLVQHLGPSDAQRSLAALDQEPVQQYFRALQSMEAELCAGLNQLGEKMALALRQRAPAAQRGEV